MSETLEEIMNEAEIAFKQDKKLKTSNSKKIYEKALEKAKIENKELEMEYIKGKLSILDKKWLRASKQFDKVLKLDNSFFKAYKYKGNALAHLKRYKDALEVYDEVLYLYSEYCAVWYNRGKVLGFMKRYDAALESYDKAIEIKSDFYGAWNNRGIILSRMRKYDDALESYDKAIEIKSDFYGAWNNRGNVLSRMRKFKESLESFDKAIEINPEYALALSNKSSIFYRMRKYEESIIYSEKALKINPKSDRACSNKGLSLSKLGKHDEAIKCIDKCLQKNPNSRILKFRKNSILMNIKKFDEIQKERESLYIEEKEDIKKSSLSKEEKDEKILEIDVQEEVINELKDDFKTILDAKNKNEKKIAFSLEPRDKLLKDNFLMVLRRWNSYTPTIPTGTESNLGGGYFVKWCGKGIVIDPGFDFLENFFQKGLVIDDIDAVIITHAHIDHCVDFESLLTLIYEYNEKNDAKKKIDVFMNLGTIKKILGWISLDEEGSAAKIKHIYPLEKGITYSPEGYKINITATDAMHDEILSKTYSVGIMLELYGIGDYTKQKPFKIGYTSDTGHNADIERQYSGSNILICHMGSVEEDDFNPALSDIDGSIADTEGNHLMLKGVISTIYKSKADLAIVSEFGEELGEHRLTIVKALDKVFHNKNNIRCLTGDIGLKVKIPDLKVNCSYCSKRNDKSYVGLDDILEDLDPLNKSKKCVIHYCKNCERVYKQFMNQKI